MFDPQRYTGLGAPLQPLSARKFLLLDRESTMKPFTRFVVLLAIFGVAAVAVHADSVPANSSNLSDFKIILNDPTCPSGTNCVDIGYDGDSDLFSVLFLAPSPFQIPPGQTAACESNFDSCDLFFPDEGDGDSSDLFFGVRFFGDTPIVPGEDLTIGVSGLSEFALVLPDSFSCENQSQCANGVINFAAAPEPPTVLLLAVGILLFGIFGRRRFADQRHRA
jgi:hypothetical protein